MDVNIKRVAAGKFRRYAGFGLMDYLRHFDIVLNNIADFFRVVAGFFQSLFRMIMHRPDVVFLKGGYVCLPVGMAARLLRIPYVVHDSDAVPGLANRLLSKRAAKIATGMPLSYYNYPENKAEWTGIPISEEFKPVSEAKQKNLKKELGFDPEKKLVLATGGSLGAEDINLTMRKILPELLKSSSAMLVAGRERYPDMLDLKEYEKWEDGVLQSNFRMVEFSSEMWKLFGAADVVVSRAGASTMTELSGMAKPVVMVPNEELPGRHQVKNAKAYEKAEAAIVVSDSKMMKKPELLLDAILHLLRSEKEREKLAKNLHSFTKDNAAESLADIIIGVAKDK
jgi:UDP-N-acetylglucosamine--N-acetylmuramyl-(pentapeptide) pyrophosphoryl-undecaprenol N-acetylglucosamine transferase